MRMKRRLIAAALLAATALPLAIEMASTATADAAAATQDVMMSNFAFAPSSVSVTAGTTVQWTNHDTAPHDVTVTSGPVAIHSPMLSTGQTWSYAFTVVGTYHYICSIHPDMQAVLTVHAAAPPPSAVSTPPTTSTSTRATAGQPGAAPLGLTQDAQPSHGGAHTAAPHARPVAASTQPAPAATTTVTVAAAATGPSTTRELKPLLIVAGVVAAVATFCLLLLASARDTPDRS